MKVKQIFNHKLSNKLRWIILPLTFLAIITSLIILNEIRLSKMFINPNERNILYFKNANMVDIRDTIIKFQNLITSFNLPVYPGLKGHVGFSYKNGLFSINQELIGELTINNLRKSYHFKEVKESNWEEFISLFNYLYNYNLKLVSLDFGLLTFNYKDYYDMYGDYKWEDKELRRYLKLLHDKFNRIRVLPPYHQVLDIKDDLVLYAPDGIKIEGVDIEYKKNTKSIKFDSHIRINRDTLNQFLNSPK